MKIKGKEKAGSSHVWWKEGRIQNDDDGIKEKEQEDREDSSTKYKRNFIILFYPGGHVLQSRQPSPFRPTLVKTLLWTNLILLNSSMSNIFSDRINHIK